jgi:hypothetical protein
LAKTITGDHGTLGAPPKGITVNKFMKFGNKVHEVHKVVVYRFRMGDVDDPDLYAAQPLYDWQTSEMGKWVMERAVDTPEWHRQMDYSSYGYQYAVVAKMKDVDYTFWQLKWGNDVDKRPT